MLKSHNARGFFICFIVTLVVLVLYMFGGLDALELKAIDFRFQWRGTRPVNPDITVVTIDEESIAKLGRWPWARETHGRLVRHLAGAGAKAVAFDSLFTEADLSHPASDQRLAQAAADTGIVVSAFFFKDLDNLFGRKPLMPYEALSKASAMGYVNLDPDRDGVTRRAALFLLEDEGQKGQLTIHPSLSVAALAVSRQQSTDDILKTLPVSIVPSDIELSQNHLFVNYAFDRSKEVYPTHSYADVLAGKVPAAAFKGKIVLVGATAAALYDLKAIPFVAKFPGVMIHANVIDNLITGNFIRETESYYTAFYVLILGLLLGTFLPRLSIWAKAGVFLAAVIGGVVVGLWFFKAHNMVIPMVPPLILSIGSYGGILFYRLVIEEREKRKIKGSFRQYLSPKIIDIITKDPSKLKLGGDEREVSIFFLDIVGFTTMSEALKPAQLVEVMNHCLTEFSNIILKHDGLINKYIGDCVMAFWNAPADQPRHAALACHAALDCISALPDLNRKFQERGLPSIDCRVGISTGVVVVGNMGSNERFDYTVLGDPVNLASRLEGANKSYHTHIMISDATFEKAKDEIEARDLDLIRVKGKKEPRKVFEVLAKKNEMGEELAEGRKRFHQGLSFYRQRAFDEAIHSFEEVFHYLPNDRVTRVYLERARNFASHPPPTVWDGVYELKDK